MTLRRTLPLLLILALAAVAARPAAAQDASGSDDAQAAAKVAPAKKAKKAVKKKKKAYDYDNSKYKAYRQLVSDNGHHSYFFDQHGNPIPVGGKKKAAVKKKKKADDDAASCEGDDTCQDGAAADGTGADASADPGQ